jgi:mannobiose 2-epimerase
MYMNKSHLLPVVLGLILISCTSRLPQDQRQKMVILREMERDLEQGLLRRWYPKALDDEFGGYLSSFDANFEPAGDQDKMIVSQARHLWNNARAMAMFPNDETYEKCANHGFVFLRDVMWDKTYGGFHTLVSRDGTMKTQGEEEKTAYGNSFGIYALAAYYAASKDTGALNLAKKAFLWLEKNSHDPVHKGYFQHMSRSGKVIPRDINTPSTAVTGYKDQNSSIHLLEAFTELYFVWPDPLLKERLQEVLLLIRDTIVQDEKYLGLFFTPDWKLISFRDSARDVIDKHFYLEHVSYGHDVETAYLMLEASHALGQPADPETHRIAKKMVDHSLDFGWDQNTGGFYDGGYYFAGASTPEVVKATKNWWTQAEGLNTLLLMSDLYPSDKQSYFEKFVQLWKYTDTYLIDHDRGEWYSGGIDKEPQAANGMKGHIWKAAYHQIRSLTNCIDRLKEKEGD